MQCEGRSRKGAQLFPARRLAAVVTALLPIAGAFCIVLFPAVDARAEGPAGSCEDAAELAILALADSAVEGRAFARPRRRGKAARRRAFADRARRNRRGQIKRAARRTAVFLVRRGCRAGRGDVACDACARRRAGRMRHHHARHRRERTKAAGAARRGRAACGRCAIHGTGRRKTCIRHGLRSCSTRRSMSSCRGRDGKMYCATARAISCSTIWVSAKTM